MFEAPSLEDWPKVTWKADASSTRVDLDTLTREQVASWKPGQRLLLSGKLITGRDAAHKRLIDMMARGEKLPVDFTNRLIYYVGPVKAVSGRLAQLVLPGDNPDVASLILEHENGALSTLNASYASASEYYLMNVYGKEATAFYDMHSGLRMLKRGETKAVAVPCDDNDTFIEELEEFANAVRGNSRPEVGGEFATTSLAVIRAGVRSAREGRRVEVAEILKTD